MDGMINIDEARAYAQEHWPSPVVRRNIEALLDNCQRVKVQHWINVKDRLPENDDDVLLATSGGIGLGYYNIYFDEWTDYTNDDNNRVTHWMPLPEPPKEG